MYDEKKRRVITCVVFAAISAALAAFRVFILNNYVEKTNGLYTNAAVGNAFFFAMLALVLIPVATAFVIKWDVKERRPLEKTASVRVGAFICMIAFSAFTVYNIMNALKTQKWEIAPSVLMAFALLSALHFALLAFGKENVSPENSLMPAFPAIFSAAAIIFMFLDTSSQINASDRSYTLLAMVLAMYFFICEAERSVILRKDEMALKALKSAERKFFIAGVISFSVIIAVCVPQLICEKNYGAEFLRNMLLVSFGLYAFVRTAKL
ncbi:MAG: hypothetical protein J6036_02490 [Clostridia bacterium]|nr:hypothetical protein [Clostridia bacterium]